ncbi:MAG: hypothetical protein AAF851_21515 [Myxococcota bacterium]
MNSTHSSRASYASAYLFVAALGVSPACGDDSNSNSNGNGNGNGNGNTDVPPAAFGVVRSDFSSTAIATLRDDGSILDAAVLDSGSQAPGLVTALSGDVVLANATRGEAGILNILDRFQTDVFSRFDLESGQILGQLRVKDGFPTNPHDMAVVDGSRGWISRFGVNTEGGQPVIDQANDVIEIDIGTFELTGRRVSLDRFTARATAMRDGGPVEVDVFARPSLVTLVDSTLVVGLTLLSREFDAASPGKVGLVDVEAATLDEFALPEASRNCGSLRAVPGRPAMVLVACSGFAQPFGEESQVRASAGVYLLEFARGTPELVKSWEPRAAPRPLAVQNVIPIDESRFVAVDYGEFGVSGDEAFVIDLDSGESTFLFQAGDAFSIGIGAFDAETGLLVMPDASEDSSGLRRFVEGGDGSFTADGVQAFTDQPLPPRSIYLLP